MMEIEILVTSRKLIKIAYDALFFYLLICGKTKHHKLKKMKIKTKINNSNLYNQS